MKLDSSVHLPENAKVYVVVPDRAEAAAPEMTPEENAELMRMRAINKRRAAIATPDQVEFALRH